MFGIVGESGSGKSVSTMALMGLLPATARITGLGAFRGQELLGVQADREVRPFAWRKMAMIFQDPMTSLNPVYPVGKQLAEAVRAHHRVDAEDGARSGRSRCSTSSASPRPERALMPTRTSSPAVCANGR